MKFFIFQVLKKLETFPKIITKQTYFSFKNAFNIKNIS